MSTAAAVKTEPSATNGPDEDAVIAVNLSKIRTAQEMAASGHASLRSILGHAEAKGVHLKAAKKAIAIIKSGDVDSWLTETQEVTRYLKIMRHGIQESQLSLEFESSLAPLDEKAALDGRSAGFDVAEETTESLNPHALSTAAGQAWLAAFRQARSERDTILSMKDDVETDDDPDGSHDAEDDED